MPKELTHWWLATEAVKQLPLDRTVRQLLEEHQSAYLVGAVLPDTLLHLVRGPWSDTALQLAQRFHEPAGSSYAPLLHYAENTALNPAATACLLGIASHIDADITFHPYICALAGDDLGQHYRLETELDLWLLYQGRKPPVFRLEELLSGQVSEVAATVLQGVFDPERKLPQEVLHKTIQLHSRIQAMYGSPYWQLLARLLGALPVPSLRRWQKLFYPPDWQRGRTKDWPDQWFHHATGRKRGDTPDGLAADALNRIAGLLRRVDEQGCIRSFRSHPGENLITGMAPPQTGT